MNDAWSRILAAAAIGHQTWVSVVIARAPMDGDVTFVKNGSARWGCGCGASGLADDERRAFEAAAQHRIHADPPVRPSEGNQ